jgi:hypothetical protein
VVPRAKCDRVPLKRLGVNAKTPADKQPCRQLIRAPKGSESLISLQRLLGLVCIIVRNSDEQTEAKENDQQARAAPGYVFSDLRYIFANFAPQFPYKLRRGVVDDGGFSLTQG